MTRKDYFETLKIGDTVTIRDWDDMADEFGIDSDGDIAPGEYLGFFFSYLKEQCGHDFTISGIYKEELIEDTELVLTDVLGIPHSEYYFWMLSIPKNKIHPEDWEILILNGV